MTDGTKKRVVHRVRKGPLREVVLRQRVPGTSLDRIVLACGHEFKDRHRNAPKETKASCVACSQGHAPGELPLEGPRPQANGGPDIHSIVALGLVEFVIDVDGKRVRCCVEQGDG